MTLCIVCFQWNSGFRDYAAEYVNILARGFKRNLSMPHRFVCITDERQGFSSDVEVVPLPKKAKRVAKIPSPEGPRFPSSYRRLWALSSEAKELGDLLFVTDIDCVVTAQVDPLIEYIDGIDFLGWRPRSIWGKPGQHRIGGGTWLYRAGAHAKVWEEFYENPQLAILQAREAGYRGSDQAYLSWKFAGCKVWPRDAGIYQAQDMKQTAYKKLPKDARLVHFNGAKKPWAMTHIPWIREHCR